MTAEAFIPVAALALAMVSAGLFGWALRGAAEHRRRERGARIRFDADGAAVRRSVAPFIKAAPVAPAGSEGRDR